MPSVLALVKALLQVCTEVWHEGLVEKPIQHKVTSSAIFVSSHAH